MVMDLVVEATVGATFGVLFTAVLEIQKRTVGFKSSLQYLQTTLVAISPTINKIEKLNNDLGLPKEQLQSLIRKMEEGTELVNECSRIRWLDFLARARYKGKLDQFVNSLVRVFAVDMQTQMARDLKETLLAVRRILSTIEKPRFDLGEAIDDAISYMLRVFLSSVSAISMKLFRIIYGLGWFFATLMRVAFAKQQPQKRKQLKRKKSYLLSVRDLEMDWGEGNITARSAIYSTPPGVRYLPDVTEIICVCWLKIQSRIKIGLLSPNIVYGAYLVFKESSKGASGFKYMPIEVSIRVAGEIKDSTIVNLVAGKQRKLGVKYPKESGDGWMEVDLGHFFISDGDDNNNNVEIGVYDIKNRLGRKAGGIIVQGIRIKPKYEN